MAGEHSVSFDTTSRRTGTEFDLHYHEAGDGDNLLLLHGSGPGVSGWSNFGSNFPVFAEHFRSFILDQPGFGLSDSPDLNSRGYFQIAVDAIARFLDHIGIDRTHILGNSLGGGVAAEFALAHPDRVGRLVLMGPGGLGTNLMLPGPSEGIKRLMDFNASPTRERLVEWLESMVANKSVLTDHLIDERWTNTQKPGAMEWSREFFSEFFGDRRQMKSSQGSSPLWARCSQLTHHTLMTWGRDDRVVTLENALLPLRQLPNVELHVFSNCGHWAMIERKAEFERVVLEFLTRED